MVRNQSCGAPVMGASVMVGNRVIGHGGACHVGHQ